MKKLLFVLVPLVTLSFFISCLSSEDTVDYSSAEGLTELIESSRDDYILTDVRTPEEYASGHIPKAINVPLQEIGSAPPTEDKESLIILYCRSGRRSALAKDILMELGYTNVHDFGGINNWNGEIVVP